MAALSRLVALLALVLWAAPVRAQPGPRAAAPLPATETSPAASGGAVDRAQDGADDDPADEGAEGAAEGPAAEGQAEGESTAREAGPGGEPTDAGEGPEEPEAGPALGEGENGEDVVGELNQAMGRLGETLMPERPSSTHRIRWDPAFPRYRFDELVITVGAGLVIGLEELLPTRTDANWRGVSDLDTAVASGLGLDDPVLRDAFEEVSDGLAALLFVWPVAIDSLLYAGLGEGAWDVAWQLSLLSLEVFALNHALTVLVRLLARRERPVGRFCRSESGYNRDPVCSDQPPAESFWSAHVSNAFASAALMCTYHDALDLYGDDALDFTACGTSIAAAVATGLFRIMSDYEWVTDVLTGAVVGSLSGILIPWILHFQGGARPPLSGGDAPTMTFYPLMGDGVLGVGAIGVL